MKRYAIARRIDGEIHFLRDGWERADADAYTDDLGCALISSSKEEIPALASQEEFVIEMDEDDEGGLSIVYDIKVVV
ncbi:hypothetical protein J5TS2_36590 [Brevibacillus halotolerans]|uniref:hypothetical protein n=1 Tax=Brevibacillus halotolerans TaxID=1507437 RepID=UPI001B0E1F67|nr:hypothetical protein [Brevibacillus halotolerans]GIO02991.1 hypothetical protein J5TS2_36590 [Brevibacillus halotolerans]